MLPDPAATAFAVAAYMGLRHGEIQGLLWENYRDGEMYVSRSIWNGRITDPKTRKGRAPVPVFGNWLSGWNCIGCVQVIRKAAPHSLIPSGNRWPSAA